MNSLRIVRCAWQSVLVLYCYLLMTVAVSGQESPQVRNSAQYVGSGRYEWTVCLSRDTPIPMLDAIDFVEYTLHPTFPNPVRRGEGRYFSLSTNGWDEFNIEVKVVFKDGRESKINHHLNLDERNDTCPKVSKKRAIRRRR